MEGGRELPQDEGIVESPGVQELNTVRRKFLRVQRHLSPEHQDFLSEMTSVLSEPDIYRNFKSDPKNIANFHQELEGMGLSKDEVNVVFDYFNLPYEQIVSDVRKK